MAITRVDSGKFSHGNTCTLDTTGANLIVTFQGCFSSIDSVTDSIGGNNNGASTPLTSQTVAGGNPLGRFEYWLNPTYVGASHVFQSASTNAYGSFVVAYSVVQAFDKESAGAASLAVTSIQPGAADSSNSDSLFLFAIAGYGTTAPVSDSSFSTVQNNTLVGGSFYDSGIFERIESGNAGSLNPTATWDATASNTIAVMAIFQAAAGGGGSLVGPLIRGGELVHGSLIRGGRLV